MKKAVNIVILFSLVMLLIGCGKQPNMLKSSSSADWAYSFLVWDNDTYEILNETAGLEEIEKEIGEVKKYSDVEGTYGNGFSNKFKAGTKLYKIKDVSTSKYIAVQTEADHYIKAKNRGKYGRK